MTTTEVRCPKCSGPVWDNRETKKNPKAPDFKCRDKSCDGVIWPEKKNGAPKPNGKQPVNIGGPLPGEYDDAPYADESPAPATPQSKGALVAAQYEATLVWVLKHVTPKLTAADIPVDAAAVNSMVATILIGASK